MGATNYTMNNILNYNFGETAYSPGATIYFGLSTSTDLSDCGVGGGTSTAEPVGGSYARVEYDNDKGADGWTASTEETLSNKAAIEFPTSSASWGEIKSLFIAESDVSGTKDVLWFQELSPAIVVGNNTTVSFAIGAVVVSME
jgi:hypothetical protein